MRRVLVVYASKHGLTKDIAEEIGMTIAEEGNDVRVIPASDFPDSVIGWDMLVAGAPMYGGRWHFAAQRFLRRHRKELTSIPVAVFGIGPRLDTQEKWQKARSQLDRVLAKRTWLTPVSVALFGGVDPVRHAVHELRDPNEWDAIRAWARSI